MLKTGKTPFNPKALSVLRWYAVGCIMLSLMYLSVNVTRPDWNTINPVIVTSLVINILTTFISAFLIIHPAAWPLFTVVHVLQGLKICFWGSGVIGLLIYAAGWMIAFLAGFFEKKMKTKFTIIAAVFLLMVSKQLQLGLRPFFTNMAHILILAIIFSVMYFLLQEHTAWNILSFGATSPESDSAKPLLPLSNDSFSPRELVGIYAIENKLPYKWIANQVHLSESAVKKEMPQLFAKFGVETQSDLRNLLIQHTVNYPPDFQISQ
jgi:DNA-binding CsgD family transcriptional regulator